jgi:hypothetical protein
VLEWLAKAIGMGFRPDRAAPNPELAWLAEDEEFQKLISGAGEPEESK